MAATARDLGDVELTEENGIVVALHEESGVASQGESEVEALENLAEALRLHAEGVPEDVDLEEPDAPWF